MPTDEWTGPDGRVRSGVPRGVEEARPVPGVGMALAGAAVVVLATVLDVLGAV